MNRLTQMLLIAAGTLTLGLSSCSDDNPWFGGDATKGKISPRVTADSELICSISPTRATETINTPDINLFTITLSKDDGTYSKSWNSLKDFPTDEGFTPGDYTLTASYGNPAEEGFNCPAFYGETKVTVVANETAEPTVNAALANSILSIQCTESFKEFCERYSFVVHTDGYGYNPVSAGETRPLYIAPGQVHIQLSYVGPNGSSVNIEPVTFQAEARHHYNVNMDVTGVTSDGSATLEIDFDDTLEQEPIVIDLSDEVLNAPEPTLEAEGFTPGTTLSHLQGNQPSSPVKFNLYAGAGIKEATLKLDSDTYTLPVGTNNEVNLTGLTSVQEDLVQGVGIKCMGLFGTLGKLAAVDVSDFLSHLPVGTHTLTLTMTDKVTRTTDPMSLTVEVEPVEMNKAGEATADYASEEATIQLGYNGSNLADVLSIVTYTETGTKFKSDLISINGEEVRSSAYPELSYTVKFRIPKATYTPMKYQLYFQGAAYGDEGEITIQNIPSYTVDATAFTTQAFLRINANAADQQKVLDNIKVYKDGSLLPSTQYEKVESTGIIIVSGLNKGQGYSFETGLLSKSTTNTVTTETEVGVPNGDFEDLAVKYEAEIQQGGRYSITRIPVWKNNTQKYTISEPVEWATTNGKTLSSEISNKNSWFYIASVFNSSLSFQTISAYPLSNDPTTPGAYQYSSHGGNNAMVVRNVAWDLNGTTPDDDSKTAVSSGYYCRNTPSSIAYRSAGAMFLGSYSFSASGMTETFNEGVNFTTRPLALKGYYTYAKDSNQSEQGYVRVNIKNGNTVIATGSVELGAASSFTEFNVPLSYTDYFLPATSLEIMIKSSNLSDSQIQTTNYCQLYLQESYGAVLVVDDLQFVYGDMSSGARNAKPAKQNRR